MLIKAGSTLLVPRTAKRDHDVSEHLADTAALALTPEQRLARRVVKARAGDTLASLGRRHGVSTAQLVAWNSKLNAKTPAQSGSIRGADAAGTHAGQEADGRQDPLRRGQEEAECAGGAGRRQAGPSASRRPKQRTAPR